jgi:hypothetical protein
MYIYLGGCRCRGISKTLFPTSVLHLCLIWILAFPLHLASWMLPEAAFEPDMHCAARWVRRAPWNQDCILPCFLFVVELFKTSCIILLAMHAHIHWGTYPNMRGCISIYWGTNCSNIASKSWCMPCKVDIQTPHIVRGASLHLNVEGCFAHRAPSWTSWVRRVMFTPPTVCCEKNSETN